MALSAEDARERRRLYQERRRREDPEAVAAIAKRAWENGGRERAQARRERDKQERFFHYRVQFARRWNPALTPDDLRALWEAQEGRCALTGIEMEPCAGSTPGWKARGDEPQLDHILPVARGGSHELANLRWVTARANRAKGDLTDDEFVALCRAVASEAQATIHA